MKAGISFSMLSTTSLADWSADTTPSLICGAVTQDFPKQTVSRGLLRMGSNAFRTSVMGLHSLHSTCLCAICHVRFCPRSTIVQETISTFPQLSPGHGNTVKDDIFQLLRVEIAVAMHLTALVPDSVTAGATYPAIHICLCLSGDLPACSQVHRKSSKDCAEPSARN